MGGALGVAAGPDSFYIYIYKDDGMSEEAVCRSSSGRIKSFVF